MMKILSYISLILAIISGIIAIIARLFFAARLFVHSFTYLSIASVLLLASIAFALHHLIGMKK